MFSKTISVLVCSVIFCSLTLGAEPRTGESGKAKPEATAAQPAVVPQWQKDLAEGQKLFKAGKFKEAVAVLEKAFEANPANLDVNFFLGRAAYESGDFETAVMAFERMLVAKPDLHRVRLELARSYLRLGLSAMAQSEFEAVLKTDPPKPVKYNITRFLDQIKAGKKRHFFSGAVTVATGWDSNVMVSPGNETVSTVIGDVILDEDSRETSDTFQSATAVLNYKYRLDDRGFFWKNSISGHHSVYGEEDEQDVIFGSARSGLGWESNESTYEFMFSYSHLTKDNLEYLNSRGFSVSASRLFSPRFLGNFTVGWNHKKYENPVDYKDSVNRVMGLRGALIFGKNRFIPNMGYEWEDSETETESYETFSTGLAYVRDLPWGFSANLGYSLKVSDYETDEDLFDCTRHDEIHDFTIGLSKRITRNININASHVWTETYSNIELYEYDRRVCTVSMTYSF